MPNLKKMFLSGVLSYPQWNLINGILQCDVDCKCKYCYNCPVYLMKEVDKQIESECYNTAIHTCNDVLRIVTNYIPAMKGKAECAIKLGEYDIALSNAEKMYKSLPSKDNYKYIIGICINLRKYNDAIKYIDEYNNLYKDKLMDDIKDYCLLKLDVNNDDKKYINMFINEFDEKIKKDSSNESLMGVYNNLFNIMDKKELDNYKSYVFLSMYKLAVDYKFIYAIEWLEKYERDHLNTFLADKWKKEIEVQKKILKTKSKAEKEKAVSSNNNSTKVKNGKKEQMKIIEENKNGETIYYFELNDGSRFTTPGGKIVSTKYNSIAQRIKKDYELYIQDSHDPANIINWQYTYDENFKFFSHEKAVNILVQSFLYRDDWTYSVNNKKWIELFGQKETRISEIREWLDKCTNLQLTAICCIGNAYESINVAYVFAQYIEKYSASELEKNIKKLCEAIAKYYNLIFSDYILADFELFHLYYQVESNGDQIKECINNEEENKYWINAEGIIECPGDNCPHECTNKCPIWLRTLAQQSQASDLKKAKEYYLEAVKIEPNFRECWNNLGNIYGQLKQFKKAKEAYLTAYNIEVTKNNLYGLILVTRDLKQYDECLNYINEIEDKFDFHDFDELKEKIVEKNNSTNTIKNKQKIESESDFYNTCIDEFHEIVKSYGLAKKGLIFVPELLQFGQTSILTYLRDDNLKYTCGNPQDYYYTIMVMALKTGLIYASAWHQDYSYLKNKLFVDVTTAGPSIYLGNIISKDLKLSDKKFLDLTKIIFSKWSELIDPYWSLEKPVGYIFKIMLAAYQLGVSMELYTLGY